MRDPFDRYLSEYKQILRMKGRPWNEVQFRCKTKRYARYPSACNDARRWINMTFPKFLACPDKYNVASNRETRMLANLTEVGCQNGTLVYGKVMLESAKRNLRSMAFFGLTEYQQENQYLFEKTFGLKFDENITQAPVNETYSYKVGLILSAEQKSRVHEATKLDRQLYGYAKTLFLKRLEYFRELDKMSIE